MNKTELLCRGIGLAERFCAANGLPMPEVRVSKPAEWDVGACAYYRPIYIAICIERCAAIGVAGMAWSYPGYVIDRTPYGVIAHEIGHHADHQRSAYKGNYHGDFSIKTRRDSGEPKLTNYCPNDAEWFAEMFRLFITNPSLLSIIRPKTFAILSRHFEPNGDGWAEVLRDAPARTMTAATKRVADALV